jgi:hypothetical protein
VNLVNAVFGQLAGNNAAGARFFKTQLGMRVQIPEDCFHFVCCCGNNWQNMHVFDPLDGGTSALDTSGWFQLMVSADGFGA